MNGAGATWRGVGESDTSIESLNTETKMKKKNERSSSNAIPSELDCEDGLALLMQDSLDNDPGFADVWAPLALLKTKLIGTNEFGWGSPKQRSLLEWP